MLSVFSLSVGLFTDCQLCWCKTVCCRHTVRNDDLHKLKKNVCVCVFSHTQAHRRGYVSGQGMHREMSRISWTNLSVTPEEVATGRRNPSPAAELSLSTHTNTDGGWWRRSGRVSAQPWRRAGGPTNTFTAAHLLQMLLEPAGVESNTDG